MRALKAQFFLSYGILGALAPLLPVFLKDSRGLNESHIGIAMSMVSASTLLSPWLMTLLADTRIETRHILGFAYGATSVVLGALLLLPAPVPVTLGLMALYGISIVAVLPLQDGLYFSTARAHEVQGEAVAAYPSVRVWGTLGFILPALLLWPVVRFTGDARPAVAVAALFCVASLLSSLKALRPLPNRNLPLQGSTRVPTIEAFRVLVAPQTRFLCLGLVLASSASVTYHYFFPIYLTEKLGMRPEWVPLVIAVGVVFEIFYTLGFAGLQRLLGVKGLILGGLICMVLRLTLLSQFPSLSMALLVQAGHGFEIVALFVAPVILLNRLAGDDFRNSMQGAFSMMLGSSRLVGSLVAGWAAKKDLFGAFQGAAVVGLVATLVIAFLFKAPRSTSVLAPGRTR
ncbi:MAG: MFS transporter [Verrucomicrobiales bacterium]